MAACNDCLNRDACTLNRAAHIVSNEFAHRMEEYCQFFKDSSRFIELPPFKEGEKLYSINYMDEIAEWTVVDIFLVSEDRANTSVGIRIKDECIFTIITLDDINKEFFLTADVAKQALKEREEND